MLDEGLIKPTSASRANLTSKATGNPTANLKTQYKTGKQMHYIRPQSFCHMNGADTFAIYYR